MGSYSFDGTNDYIQYAEAAALDALEIDQYLILTWSRPGTGGSNNGRIFTRDINNSTGQGHMNLMIGNGTTGGRAGNFTSRQDMNTTDANLVSADNVVPDSVWSCFGHSFRDSTDAVRMFEAGAAITPAAGSNPSGAAVLHGTDPVTVGDSGTTPTRPYNGHIAYIGIWNISTLDDTAVDALVAAFYNSATGTADVPRQDVLVEFLRLDTSGATTGDKGVLANPTVSGAAFDSGESSPVTYNALAGGGATPHRRPRMGRMMGAGLM